ncbi:MAG TPA: VWA domain-containing protein, partial [Polyangiales bacterium]|nr:VWA domain-containing protein [Polyangiales bacterium]
LAVAFVKGLEANGGTPAGEALDKAFTAPNANLVFFVSDGQPTDGSTQDILAKVRQLNAQHKVQISSVGLGDDQDGQFLAELAKENGGQYVKK